MDIPDLLFEFGLPLGAGVLAWGLVKGADFIEEGAKEERLKYISDLLKDHSFTSYGMLAASVVPLIFEKVFGSNPISIKFAFRSILASLLFWCILLTIKHTSIITAFSSLPDLSVVPALLFIDWLCLVKAKFILTAMSKQATMLWSILFVVADLFTTAVLLIIIAMIYLLSYLTIRTYKFLKFLGIAGWSCFSQRSVMSP